MRERPMLRTLRPAAAMTILIALSGCGSESSPFGGPRANIAGAASLIDTQKLETISVDELINFLSPGAPTLEDAIAGFDRATIDETAKRRVRNNLQDRILVASQSRCGYYEEYLKRFQ